MTLNPANQARPSPTPRLQPVRRFARLLLASVLAGLMMANAVADPAPQSATVAPVFHPSFKSASDAATADQSLVLLVFSAQWCGPCKLLKSKTLASDGFLHQENPLHVADVDIDADQKMAHTFSIEAVPTLILLTGDGKIISRQTGYMETEELMAWIKTGRSRAAAGQWEGTVPSAPVDELTKKAAADNLGTNDIQRLVELLGDSDPANRDQVAKILLNLHDAAVPPLIAAVTNAYLGVRIGAGELLQRLAPSIPAIDPWQSPSDMSNTVVALQSWWAKTGTLPEPAATSPTNSVSANAIKEALEELRGDDPVRRTRAMTELVGYGADTLPAVREALKRAEHGGDQRTLGLLEDVRWTILVPDTVEQQSGGVRNVLARGKSTERQAATERLGHIGKAALGVLVELAGDSDPLVVESAVHALSGLGGENAVSALTALVQSPDSNLRMTAAQALGHTKNSQAIKPLLTLTTDTDEVVACTALSALEENQSHESYGQNTKTLSSELSDGLKHCLTDTRWRVRATAAEVAGKLEASNLADDLKKLLDDKDGYVVTSALTALSEINAMPDSEALVALSKRLPSLQADIVGMMLKSSTDDTVKTVSTLFDSGNVDTQLAILNAFLGRFVYDNEETDEGWKPMMKKAITATDPRLRHVAVEVLSRRSPKLSAGLVEPLLSDADPETRRTAASIVLQILNQNDSGSPSSRTRFSTDASTKTNQPLANAARLAKWHAAMVQHLGPNPDLDETAAIFATGDGKTDLPMLLQALARTNAPASSGLSDRRNDLLVVGAVMTKVVLPDGRPLLDKICEKPMWFAQAVSQSKNYKPEVADYLFEPARFKAVLEPASGTELTDCLDLLAGYDYEYSESTSWLLWNGSDHAKGVTSALVDSTNAAWRAAAVFALGLRGDAKDNLAVFTKAATDPNPWVRGSAVRALARNCKERPALEQSVGPLLADTNLLVAATAAMALLEPETRTAAGLDSELSYFEYESQRGGRYQVTILNQGDDRPLAVLDEKPAFLAAAQKWLTATNGVNTAGFALLLAQFGDFSGVDRLAAQPASLAAGKEDGASPADALLAGIALSHDTKYVPVLKQMAAVRNQDQPLRKVLQAMKGMTGPDARQLRLEINKKLRTLGGNSSGTTID